MLKFLDGRTHEKPKKSPIKYKPEMVYGISVESPSNFQTPYTLINSETYINPYLQIQQKRVVKLPSGKSLLVKPEWTKKTNLQLVQEQKILSGEIDKFNQSPVSKYRKSYNEEYDKCNARFKITRGEFTDFIEKNNRYKSVAPLHGVERTSQRIQNSKKSVWVKPDRTSVDGTTKMLYSTYYEIMRQSSIKSDSLHRNQTCISNNSKLLSEKIRIRDNRQKMNISFHKGIQDRKNSLQFKVQLPKLQSQILTGYKPSKIRANHGFKRQEQQLQGIDEFQQRLRKHFK